MSHHTPRISLTFDDGPIPEQTPWVLDILDQYNIKATFFVVGDNVRKYPDVFREVVARGHEVGNHTFNHVQMLRMSWRDYVKNIRLCSEEAQKALPGVRMRFFRAPHGQITPWRCRELTTGSSALMSGLGFTNMVFWDVMPMDYDSRLTPREVAKNTRTYLRDGSVIVMHDSIKAGERMRYALSTTIDEVLSKGWHIVPIP
ncbi:MAG: polysaccharide deacetylase family protein [Marinilabiliaceae bacterium]|nr:polysaccharide deacetylase family protein [Marinilabiliaceae bacterium]